MKGIGSVLIVTASVGMAYCLRQELSAHLRLLYELRRLLVDISCAAFQSMQPMEILLGCFVRTGDERLNVVCKEIADRLMEKRQERGEEVWREVFAEHEKELGLGTDEAELLQAAGSAFFGKSAEENKKHLAVLLERLDFAIETARAEKREKQRVYGTLCVLCGLMLVILLV